jgi:hypothetical protein
VTVSAGGKSRTLSAPASESQIQAKLINPKTGKPDEMSKNWHDKVWRMMVTDALGKGEMPAAGTPQVGCKIEYAWHGKPKGFTELARTQPPAVASNQAVGPGEQWARSERTASWDKLPGNADELIKECSKVAAGE